MDSSRPGQHGAPLARLEGLARAQTTDERSASEHEAGWHRLAPRLDRRRPSWSRPLLVTLGLGVGAAALTMMLRPSPGPAPLRFDVEGNSAGGDRYVVAPPAGPAQVRFSEGTRATFAAGARGRVVSSSPVGARLGLEHGRLGMKVVKRPLARWSVEAGPFTVEVTGTEFELYWASAEGVLEVVLRTGGLVVRSPFSQSTLVPGQRLRASVRERQVHISGPAQAAALPQEAPAPAQASAPSVPTPRIPRRKPANTPAWRDRVRAGQYDAVVRDAEARGLASVLTGVPNVELSALADAALFSGNPALAKRAWAAQRDRFPSSFEAGQAAFRLGRLAEDHDRDLPGALSWYDRYLAESPRGAYTDEALGRRMVAVQRTRGMAEARALAGDYLRRFPRGTYAAAARALSAAR